MNLNIFALTNYNETSIHGYVITSLTKLELDKEIHNYIAEYSDKIRVKNMTLPSFLKWCKTKDFDCINIDIEEVYFY